MKFFLTSQSIHARDSISTDFFYFFKNKFYFYLISYIFIVQKRIEGFFYFDQVKNTGKNNFIFLYFFFFSTNFISNYKKRWNLNLYIYDVFFTYKGWRFFKNLPVNGQRTWTNSNSAAVLNNTTRQHKTDFFKKVLGLNSTKNIEPLLLLEYYNLLWKLQWEDEWFELKKNKINFLKKKIKKEVFISEELILAELVYIRSKFLKKKVRVQFKGGSNLLGFEPLSFLNYN